MTTSGCPSDETFTRLVEGLLPDAELRALEAHCDGCLSCSRLMAELARSLSPSGGGLLGDRYRLLEPLGAGGMGVVYAAFDTKLGRKVAVKRLRETGLGSSAEKRRSRFMREAQLLASLSHPNVLTVHDVGGADRELYVVMELVDGAPVSRWLAEARPGWQRIVDVFLQAGRGLVAAHQLGIVHRDVKPDNILVANSGRVLVGDFGLAGLAGSSSAPIDSPSPSPGTLTETGAVLGTPAYMAPEQHDGKTGDAQSDQFSFAVSLYESLHGRRPFAGRSAGEIAAATRSGQLAVGGDGVPRAIDRALARALDPEPTRRYPALEELLAALESARTRARRPPAAAAVVVGLVLAAGAAGALVLWPRATSRPPSVTATPTAAAPATVAPAAPPATVAPAAPPAHPAPPARPRPNTKLAQATADADKLLAHAAKLDAARDGAGCLAALDQVSAWPPDLAEVAEQARAGCEMLAGRCEAGRKRLEAVYARKPQMAEKERTGMAQVRSWEKCPIRSLPTAKERINAVAIQAKLAQTATSSDWCRDLEASLARDTASQEVDACMRERGTGADLSKGCFMQLFALEDAYRHVSNCLLKRGLCAEGAAVDVMHTQLEWHSPPGDGDAESWCRPGRVRDWFPSCAAAGDEARRKCVARFEALRRDGTPVMPEIPR